MVQLSSIEKTVPVAEGAGAGMWVGGVRRRGGQKGGAWEGVAGGQHRPGCTQVESTFRSVLLRRYAAFICPNKMLAAAVCNLCAGKHEQLPRRPTAAPRRRRRSLAPKLTPVRASMLPVVVKDAAMLQEPTFNVAIGCFCRDLPSRAASSNRSYCSATRPTHTAREPSRARIWCLLGQF